MRKATLADVPLLVTMMAEFYSDSPYTLNPRRAKEAFTSLLSDERLGHVWVIEADSKDVGYIVVTLCHSMTYGGLSAVVDDFFVKPVFRGVGLGKAALTHVRSFCASHGIRAMQVETGHDNGLPWRSIGTRGSWRTTWHTYAWVWLNRPTRLTGRMREARPDTSPSLRRVRSPGLHSAR
jgi:GNAT superfamily N-acetyltransferase